MQRIRNPFLVRIISAHPHRIATYDQVGEQTIGGAVVVVLVEFCPGGSLQDHLIVLEEGQRGESVGVDGGKGLKERGQRDEATRIPDGDDAEPCGGDESQTVFWMENDAVERKLVVWIRDGIFASRLETWIRQVRLI